MAKPERNSIFKWIFFSLAYTIMNWVSAVLFNVPTLVTMIQTLNSSYDFDQRLSPDPIYQYFLRHFMGSAGMLTAIMHFIEQFLGRDVPSPDGSPTPPSAAPGQWLFWIAPVVIVPVLVIVVVCQSGALWSVHAQHLHFRKFVRILAMVLYYPFYYLARWLYTLMGSAVLTPVLTALYAEGGIINDSDPRPVDIVQTIWVTLGVLIGFALTTNPLANFSYMKLIPALGHCLRLTFVQIPEYVLPRHAPAWLRYCLMPITLPLSILSMAILGVVQLLILACGIIFNAIAARFFLPVCAVAALIFGIISIVGNVTFAGGVTIALVPAILLIVAACGVLLTVFAQINAPATSAMDFYPSLDSLHPSIGLQITKSEAQVRTNFLSVIPVFGPGLATVAQYTATNPLYAGGVIRPVGWLCGFAMAGTLFSYIYTGLWYFHVVFAVLQLIVQLTTTLYRPVESETRLAPRPWMGWPAAKQRAWLKRICGDEDGMHGDEDVLATITHVISAAAGGQPLKAISDLVRGGQCAGGLPASTISLARLEAVPAAEVAAAAADVVGCYSGVMPFVDPRLDGPNSRWELSRLRLAIDLDEDERQDAQYCNDEEQHRARAPPMTIAGSPMMSICEPVQFDYTNAGKVKILPSEAPVPAPSFPGSPIEFDDADLAGVYGLGGPVTFVGGEHELGTVAPYVQPAPLSTNGQLGPSKVALVSCGMLGKRKPRISFISF